MFTPALQRPPAPDLTPDEYCTWFEFEHGGADTFEEVDRA